MSLDIEMQIRCRIAEENGFKIGYAKGLKIGEEKAKRRLLQELKELNISTNTIKSLKFLNEHSNSNDTVSPTRL